MPPAGGLECWVGVEWSLPVRATAFGLASLQLLDDVLRPSRRRFDLTGLFVLDLFGLQAVVTGRTADCLLALAAKFLRLVLGLVDRAYGDLLVIVWLVKMGPIPSSGDFKHRGPLLHVEHLLSRCPVVAQGDGSELLTGVSDKVSYCHRVDNSMVESVVGGIMFVADVVAIAYCLYGACRDRRRRSRSLSARDCVSGLDLPTATAEVRA